MTLSQSDFRAAVLDAGRPVPAGLRDAGGGAAGARFSVYRNNVIVSLCDALTTAFPLVAKLVGAASFARLANIYVRAHPPSSPLMMFYGAEFPAFLDGFEPLKHYGYLPDCARLDLAMRQSYHAADAPGFDPSVLQQPEEAALRITLALAPASRIVRSKWPLHDLWRFNMEPGAPKPRALAQDVLVTRPEFDPQPHPLPQGAADWLDFLHSGMPLGAATDKVLSTTPAFDLTASLTLALTSHALVNTTAKEN